MATMDDSPGSSVGTSELDPSGQVLDDDNKASGTESESESESSSRSVTPEPSPDKPRSSVLPSHLNMECKFRVRNMLPRFVLPRRLDPRFVAIQAPTDLPLCWLGIPFSFDSIFVWAENTGPGVPYTEGYYGRIPGSIDVMKSWLALGDCFYEDTGITIHMRDVWGAPLPIITFISNRQTCDITMDQHQGIEDLLEDMGIRKKDEPMWYLDRRELY